MSIIAAPVQGAAVRLRVSDYITVRGCVGLGDQ